MKAVKVLGFAVIGLAVLAFGIWQFWLRDQLAYADVATAYGAKMVCSCRFVAGRGMKSCKGDFTEDVSAISFTEEGRTIRTHVLGGVVSAEARHTPGLGCTLVRPQ